MFKIKNYISKIINVFGYEIQRHSSNSLNVKEPFYHFRNMLKNIENPIIFDIGAYVGDTVELFKKSFSESNIHAFEPFPISFDTLNKRFIKTENFFLNNLAVGDSTGVKKQMYITKNKGSSSLLKPEKNANKFWQGNPLLIEKKLEVETITIDYYCQKNNIEKIDLLKIDVQGNEIEVLKGAEQMLKNRKVKLIFTEISIAPNYKGQTDIDVLIKLLKGYKYTIFNFFKMRHKDGKLIECDVLFYLE